jgi:hypothetical protein
VSWDKALEAVQFVHASYLVRPELRWPASVATSDRPKRAILYSKGFTNLVVRPVMVAVLGLLAFAAWHLNLPLPAGILVIACLGFAYTLAAWERAVADFGMFAQTRPFLNAPASPEEARHWFQAMKAWYESNRMAGTGRLTPAWGRRLTQAFQAVYAVVCRRASDGPLEMPDVSALSPQDQAMARQAVLLLEELPPEPSDFRLNRLVGPEIYVEHAIVAVGVVLLATILAHAANPSNVPDVAQFVRTAVDGLTPPPAEDEERDAGADAEPQGRSEPVAGEAEAESTGIAAARSIDGKPAPPNTVIVETLRLQASSHGMPTDSAVRTGSDGAELFQRRKPLEAKR